jgi:hypothetical protein
MSPTRSKSRHDGAPGLAEERDPSIGEGLVGIGQHIASSDITTIARFCGSREIAVCGHMSVLRMKSLQRKASVAGER